MHIAIYSYKVADRKQMERLMEREADKWIKEGNPIYVYAFGSTESLMASTMIYDAVMVDLCDTDTLSLKEIISIYSEKKLATHVIECAYERTVSPDDERNFFLQKDIKAAELHDVMVKVSEIKKKDAAKIELRAERETVYVEEPDIMYITQKGPQAEVHLKDGRIIGVYGHVENLYCELEVNNPTIILASLNTVINVRYIKKISFNTVIMCDDKKVKMSLWACSFARKAVEIIKTSDDDIIEKLKNIK